MKPCLRILLIYIAVFSVALAQTDDMAVDEQKPRSVETERGQLANQRIQAEMEIRAREEQRRVEEAEQARLRAQEEAASSTDMSRVLQQLKSLGELKDDGYITEEEFQRIKQKILDSQT